MGGILSTGNVAGGTRQATALFTNLMLLNYLTHGINIQTNPTAQPPQDALTAIFGGALSPQSLNGVHSLTHISAGLVGAIQVVLQAQSMARGSSSSSTSSP